MHGHLIMIKTSSAAQEK